MRRGPIKRWILVVCVVAGLDCAYLLFFGTDIFYGGREYDSFEYYMRHARDNMAALVELEKVKPTKRQLSRSQLLSPEEIKANGFWAYEDRWGHPLRFVWDNDLDGSIVLGGQTQHVDSVVYSVGPNGLDEEGEGDDVSTLRMGSGRDNDNGSWWRRKFRWRIYL